MSHDDSDDHHTYTDDSVWDNDDEKTLWPTPVPMDLTAWPTPVVLGVDQKLTHLLYLWITCFSNVIAVVVIWVMVRRMKEKSR